MRGLRFVCSWSLGSTVLLASFAALALARPAIAGGQRIAFDLGPVEGLGDGPSYFELGAGAFDFNQDGSADNPSTEGRVEFRWGRKLFIIGPAIGLMVNADGGVFGYGGFYADFRYHRFVVTPLLALGGYRQGGSKDLGGIFQFRIGLGFSYQVNETVRLGVRLAHISSASIHDNNPGEEELLLTYAVGF